MQRDVLETGINREYVEEVRGASSPLGQPRNTTEETNEVPTVGLRQPKVEDSILSRSSDKYLGTLKPISTPVTELGQDYRYGESVWDANVRQWGTTKLVNVADWKLVMDRESRFGADQEGFDMAKRIQEQGYALSEREFETLVRYAPRNDAELDYLVQGLQQDKKDLELMGQHPVKSFAYGAPDPVYTAVGYGIGSASRMLQMGRIAGGISAGVADASVASIEYAYNPNMTGEDVAANLILGTAFGTAFGGNKPRVKDVEAPTRVMTDAEQLAEMEALLQANVGGYHDGNVGTFTKVDGKFVQIGEGTETLRGVKPFSVPDTPYSQPTYTTYTNVDTVLDANGRAIQTPKNSYGVDSPQAYIDRTRISAEMKDWKQGKDAGVSDWRILKDKYYSRTAKDPEGLPTYDSIDWKAKNADGVTLDKTAFHSLYKLLDNPKVPKALQSTARAMLTHGSDFLMSVKATMSRNKATDATKRSFGWFDPNKNKIHVRDYADVPKDTVHFTTAHEAMHALTYPKIEYAKANPNSTHGRIVKEAQDLINHIQELIAYDPKVSKQFKELPKSQRFAIDYALSNPHEFFSALAELSNPKLKAFRELLDSTPVPDNLKARDTINNRSVLQYLANALRKLLGLDIDQGNALFKALELGDELLDSPTIELRGLTDGKLRSIEVADPNVKGKLMEASMEEAEAELKTAFGERLGKMLAWNSFKTIDKFAPNIAKWLLNDPLGTNPGNVQQIRQGIRTNWIDKYRTVWEEDVKAALKDDGVKFYEYISNPKKVRDAQTRLAEEVAEGMVHIEAGKYNPDNYSQAAQKIISTMDKFTREAAEDLVAEGLLPPQVLDSKGGYFPRKWDGQGIIDLQQRIADNHFGGDTSAALDYLTQQFAGSIRYEGLTDAQRLMYSRAMLQRAIAKADNTDLIYRGHLGMDTAYEIRRMLEGMSAEPKDVQRIMDVVTGKIEEAGKDSWQKQRMDIDMTHKMLMPDGTILSVHDLMDKRNLLQNMARYLEDTSGRLALARKGIKDTATMANVQRELVEKLHKGGMPKTYAEQITEDLFNDLLGRPVGEVMHQWGRIISGMTQMMALRNSGFWQVTELAKTTMRSLMNHGALGTAKFMGQAFGDYKDSHNPKTARQLHQVLARQSYNEVRLRPFVDMFEDNYAVKSNRMSAFQHGVSSVYHINGMAHVQRYQANMAARGITATLDEAVNGNVKLQQHLAKFGMTDELLGKVKTQMDRHGYNIDDWDSRVWSDTNTVLMAMMDVDVLRSTTGDVPLFFQFSTVGKILGTFQNFTLTSHNKIMASTLYNDGIKGFALLMAMQLPLTMLMTQVSSISGGRGVIEDPYEWALESASQAGGFGLFTMSFNAMKGNSSVGGAMMISLDKTQDILAKTITGDFTGALDTATKNIPLVSLMPGWGLAIETLKGED